MIETLKSFDPSNLHIGLCARGSASWSSHVTESLHCIEADDWDYVVLQEQSTMLLHRQKENASIRHAVTLADNIRENNNETKILLFETWAYENGWGFLYDTPEKMQEGLFDGYMEVAKRIDASPALIGEAVLYSSLNLPMWDLDGRHPSKYTSYLAACMFYLKIGGSVGDFKCPFKRVDCEFLGNVSGTFIAIA